MSKAVIPNLPPISSIKDPDVRVALEQMWNAWRVRNGDVGDGTHKFLTAADLKDALDSTTIVQMGGGGDDLTGSTLGKGVNTSWIRPLLSKIDDYIMQSYTWKKLGERIEWIDTPEWFQDKFGAAIKTEQIERQTETAALSASITTAVSNINGNLATAFDEIKATSDLAGATASRVTTLQTQVNGVKASAEEALRLSQTIDGVVKGAWTVKFDVNGYVAGAGLGIEGKNGTISSNFYVRADRFAVGNPEAPGIPSKIPFKVFTTNTTLPDGTVVPPGVYIDAAIIADGSINNAKIGNAAIGNAEIQVAAIDTLNVRGNAVTTMAYGTGGGGDIGYGEQDRLVAAASLSMPSNASGAVINTSVQMASYHQSGSTAYVRIYRNGTLLKFMGLSVFNGFRFSYNVTAFDPTPVNGINTYEFRLSSADSGPGAGNPFQYLDPSIQVTGGKR